MYTEREGEVALKDLKATYHPDFSLEVEVNLVIRRDDCRSMSKQEREDVIDLVALHCGSVHNVLAQKHGTQYFVLWCNGRTQR